MGGNLLNKKTGTKTLWVGTGQVNPPPKNCIKLKAAAHLHTFVYNARSKTVVFNQAQLSDVKMLNKQNNNTQSMCQLWSEVNVTPWTGSMERVCYVYKHIYGNSFYI